MLDISWILFGILIICPFHDAADIKDEDCNNKYLNCLGTGGMCVRKEDEIICECPDDTMLTDRKEKCITDDNCNKEYTNCLSTGGTCVLRNDGIICECPDHKIFTDRNEKCAEYAGHCDDESQFTCFADFSCIPIGFRCDGSEDCDDRSDEQDCAPEILQVDDAINCSRNQFECSNSTKCIEMDDRCDGLEDCEDGSDEQDCDSMEFIFFNEGTDVYMKKLITKSGEEYTRLVNVSLNENAIITGLSFDVKRRNLYISDAATYAIYSVHVSCNDLPFIQCNETTEMMLSDRIAYPVDIAFDWESDNLYWMDSDYGTVEVFSLSTKRRSIIVEGLVNPTSLALSPTPDRGFMYIATAGPEPSISVYGMDGWYWKDLCRVQGSPASLALHPSKNSLYWTDTLRGEISYVGLGRDPSCGALKTGLSGIMSLTVGEDDIFFTYHEEFDSSEKVHRLKLGTQEMDSRWKNKKDRKWKSITSTFGMTFSGKSKCLINNGGCDYICLTADLGKSRCAGVFSR